MASERERERRDGKEGVAVREIREVDLGVAED